MGGLLESSAVNGAEVAGGPQMFQLSLDGDALCHHFVALDLGQQFYPEIRTKGGVMVMIDCDVENGGMAINEDFIVDFGQEPNGLVDATRLATQVATAQVISALMDTWTVTVTNQGGAKYDVDASRPLLETLEEQGVDLPYGCRYGGCITCAAKVTSGKLTSQNKSLSTTASSTTDMPCCAWLDQSRIAPSR